jgi:hypothetical protein
MKIATKDIAATLPPKQIKVQLDSKTLIYLRHSSSLKIWLKKYPEAKVVKL